MSYLVNSGTPVEPRTASDFNCGWSVVNVLAELSLKAAPAPKPPRRPRRVAKVSVIATPAATESAKTF